MLCGFSFGTAAEHGLDLGDQFPAAERFGQIVIRSHLKPDDPIDLLALGGQHDDRDIRLSAQSAAERESIFSRQHQIEQNKVDPAIRQHIAHGAAVRRRADAESLLA